MAERIVVAMSGGVDSSVAAALLQAQGYDVIGVTLQLWGKDVCVSSGTRLCCSVRDTLDAKAVAKRLGIRHEVLALEETFRATVIDYFVSSYRQGLTPNPCIACNDHIKFGSLLEHADALDASGIATGHYARAACDPITGRFRLQRAVDATKDQSYVLFNLTQAQLARARFPLGELSKAQVREAARALGLETAEKPDSQDVCFVRDRDKDGFLRRTLQVGDEPGLITDTEGKVLGRHQGVLGYTVGQREGLGLAVGKPLYVIAVDQVHNRLVVGSKMELLRRVLLAERINWVSIPPPQQPIRAWVKIRSRHEAAAASVTPQPDGRVRVEFDEPQSALTPGQAAVFYGPSTCPASRRGLLGVVPSERSESRDDGDLLLGGGWIVPSDCAEGVNSEQ